MKKKLVGMLATATLLTMALAGNVQAAEIRSVGPDGEAAVDASTIELTDDQIAQIKEGGYTAAICLHYGGNDWSTSQQKGLEDTFGELGIEIVAVTDANFSAETQVSNIETVMAKKPDILVSIPTDATATADAYKQAAAAGIKIVFMDQRADGLEAGKDYVSVVSADNYGNGYASGTVLGDALGGKGKVAMVYYDANFAPTNQRDEGFRDAMKNYPDIEIVTEQGFTDESGCAEQGDAILTQFPNIDGIYASWDVPMEGVLSAVRAAGMEGKVTLACNDLGNNVAREIASGNIAGGGAQMPYDQGVAEAKLAALALLGEETPSYVAVPAETVTHALDIAQYLAGNISEVVSIVKTYITERPVQEGGVDLLGTVKLGPDAKRKPVDVDDEVTTLLKFENGTIGSCEATRMAWGRNNYITLEVHGTKGSISWCYERLNELNVCYGMEDQDGERGFKTIYTGPANPHGDVTWNIPGMNIGYGELKAIEMYEFGKAIVEGYQPSTNFGVGYRLDRVCDAILESNETGSWVKVK